MVAAPDVPTEGRRRSSSLLAPAAVLVLVVLYAAPLARSVYRIPVQPSEVLDIVHYVDEAPTVAAAFRIGLHASDTMLRPLRQAHTKLLLDLSRRLGNRYHAVFRGTHAILTVALVALFALAARPRTATDVAAFAVGLAVLAGLHTFGELLREAYPVNHFLLVAVYACSMLVLARTRGGMLADAAAALLTVLAVLTLESGVLVAVVAAAAYAAGLRGVSRRGLALIGVVIVAYAVLRVGVLGIGTAPFAEREIGFGAGTLGVEAQRQMFGDARGILYAYNVGSAAATVLLSQPRSGTWTIAAAVRNGAVPPWMVVHLVTSILTSGFLLWYAVARDASGRRGFRDPLVMVAAVVLVASALLSYTYTKDEIVSTAGVFYALAVYAAVRGSLARLGPTGARLPFVLCTTAAVVVVTLWSVRVFGTHYRLREQAFQVRNDWAYLVPQGPFVTTPLTRALKVEALSVDTIAPRALDRQVQEWLGGR